MNPYDNGINSFLDELGMKESSDRYDVVSSTGAYWGKYQIGPSALIDIGFYDDNYSWTEKAKEYGVNSKETFLTNPEAQDETGIWVDTKLNWLHVLSNDK